MGSSSDIVPDRSSLDRDDVSGNHHSPADDVTDTKIIPTEEPTTLRRTRPSRACTVRAQQRLQEQQAAERKLRLPPKKEYKREHRRREEEPEEDEDVEEDQEEEEDGDESKQQCVGGGGGSSSKIVTSLVPPPEPSQMPRWNLRSMWELASVLNFLHVSSLFSSILSFFVFSATNE